MLRDGLIFVHPLHIFGGFMKNITLDSRLLATASFVRKGAIVADIGTDHAYLVAYLLLNKTSPKGFACDIKPNPLKKAASTIKKYGLTDKVDLVLCDGLSGLKRDDADDVVIAGMGGETIADILSDCLWSKDIQKHYILQPMTKADVLRKYLCDNGYVIETEKAVCDRDKVYTIMSVYYKDKLVTADALYCEIGEHAKNKNAESIAYIKNRAAVVLKKADGIARVNPALAEKMYDLYNKITECL